jgi:succinate dehydrogenase hydrophobic anchor subunit
MSEETGREIQELKQQVALLQQESARTRTGWLTWMRMTGVLLLIYAAAVLAGVLCARSKIESNPVAITFTVSAIFMAACGGWCLLWSVCKMAEKLMKTA